MRLLNGLSLLGRDDGFLEGFLDALSNSFEIVSVSDTRRESAQTRIEKRGSSAAAVVVAWELKQEQAEHKHDLVLVPGLRVARALAPNVGLHDKLIIALTNDDARDLSNSGFSPNFVMAAGSAAKLILGDSNGLSHLLRLTPDLRGRVALPRILLSSARPEFLSSRASHSISAEQRLELLSATDRRVVFGTHESLRLTDASRGSIAVTLAESGKTLRAIAEEDHLPPRLWKPSSQASVSRAAYQLRTLCEDLEAISLIVDEPCLAKYCLEHADLSQYTGVLATDENVHVLFGDSGVVPTNKRNLAPLWASSEEIRSYIEVTEPELIDRVGLWDSGQSPSPILGGQVSSGKAPARVVIAGHDFKFARHILESLSFNGDTIFRQDHWPSQYSNSAEHSSALADWADVIWCEFGSRNAVWYSHRKQRGQRLVVRVHGYEVTGPWLDGVQLDAVDLWIFVSEHLRAAALTRYGMAYEQTLVVPNAVNARMLDRIKLPDARFRLGLVGITPMLKRPDRALDLLETLIAADDRYSLHIRGMLPYELDWVWGDRDMRDTYEAFFERIRTTAGLRDHVSIGSQGPDMSRWYRNVGWVLSPSSRESFHLAPVEGMASGAIPISWAREGAHYVLPAESVYVSLQEMAVAIMSINEEAQKFEDAAADAKRFANQYDVSRIAPIFANAMLGVTEP